jgi:hypothetical protein
LIRETGFEAFLVNLGCCPLEWAGGLVVGFDESVDVGLPARIENQSSTWLSQDARGWRKMEVHVWMALQPAVILRLVRVEIVEDDMDLVQRF